VPLHAPLHPAKREFGSAAAVSVTWVPALNPALQVCPQSIPAGLLVTVPAPVPERVTVNTGSRVNVADADSFPFIFTVHVPVPLHAPLHPAKREFGSAAAVSVTWDPALNPALQVCPQSIPGGLLVIVPVPVPESVTVNTGTCVNVAETDWFPFIVTEHVPVPLQAPLHPAKKELASGVALRVTCVPLLKPALQVWPQLTPDGLLAIVPPPVPETLTVNTGEEVNVAVTDLFAFRTIEQSPVPVQSPAQPVKVEPESGVAVSVTAAPDSKLALQVFAPALQLIPPSLLVTVPVPFPVVFTVS